MAFPTNLDSFSVKTSGQTISESHVNDVQTAIVATETKIGYGADTPVSGDFFKGTGTGTSGWSAFSSSDLPAGSVVQVVNTQTGAESHIDTTQMPYDDTIPQNDEGNEFLTLAITPTSATNKLIIECYFTGSIAGVDNVVAALFQDSTANALAATAVYPTATDNASLDIYLPHYMEAGTTSETTFKLRVGSASAYLITMNGASSSRKFGGVCVSGITIKEIKV